MINTPLPNRGGNFDTERVITLHKIKQPSDEVQDSVKEGIVSVLNQHDNHLQLILIFLKAVKQTIIMGGQSFINQ